MVIVRMFLHGHGMVALAEGIMMVLALSGLPVATKALYTASRSASGVPVIEETFFGSVPVVMLFHQLEDAVRVLQRIVALDQALCRPSGTTTRTCR